MLGTDDKGEIEKHNIHTRRGLSRGPGPVPDGTWHHVGRGARRRRAFLDGLDAAAVRRGAGPEARGRFFCWWRAAHGCLSWC